MKAKYKLTIGPNRSPQQKVSPVCVSEDMHYSVHSNTTHNNLKLKITQMAVVECS